MEKDIVDGTLGDMAAYDLEFKEGKLKLKLSASLKQGGVELGAAGMHMEVDASHVLDALAKAIPGQWDDMALNGLKALLKA